MIRPDEPLEEQRQIEAWMVYIESLLIRCFNGPATRVYLNRLKNGKGAGPVFYALRDWLAAHNWHLCSVAERDRWFGAINGGITAGAVVISHSEAIRLETEYLNRRNGLGSNLSSAEVSRSE